MTFNQVVEGVGKTIDGAGVAVIVVGALADAVSQQNPNPAREQQPDDRRAGSMAA